MAVTETEQRIIRYNDAFNETLAELLREDPDIFIAGEDVGRYGGAVSYTHLTLPTICSV